MARKHGFRVQVEFDQAEQFLECLAPDGNLTFQTFSDRPKGSAGIGPSGVRSKNLNRILQGSFAQHAPVLAQINAQGAGVFVMVNEGDQKGRKKENVIRARALFVDLDGSPLAPVVHAAVKPHLVVESSPGRYHAYWLVKDCALDQFPQLQAALAEKFGGDPTVKDLPRVMRLPGFFHQKGEPFMTQLLRSPA